MLVAVCGLLAASAIAAQEPATPPTVSLAEAFFIQRHPETGRVEWLGSLIIWLLLASSAASLGYLGVQIAELRPVKLLPARVRAQIDRLAKRAPSPAIQEVLIDDTSLLGAAVRAAHDRHDAEPAVRLAAAEHAAGLEVERVLRRIEPLNIAAQVAPMVGLFGTVYGMILAFREIVAAGGAPDPVGLAAGIGTALTTTFWGLVVAIPAATGHASLRNAVEGAAAHAVDLVEDALGGPSPGTPA
ncbi:MAG: MotA/TolQ/ExbB proton channel family protein [Planctomycetota bacterium]